MFKYIRTLRNLNRTAPRAAHLLDEAPVPELEVEDEEPGEEELMARLLASDDVEEQIEILAVMRQGGFRPPTRGQGGQRRFAPLRAPALQELAPRLALVRHHHETERTSRASIATGRATLHPNGGSQE